MGVSKLDLITVLHSKLVEGRDYRVPSGTAL
jgi:hypothetical protein